ncbi:MAG: hypothetical protein GY874_14930 [Desulfobacteraceae bacterium]|nr:hypothetical protein [Desulfobacteraceae bacterium]
MVKRFSAHLREAMIYRRQTKLPNVVLIFSIVTTCILAYILLALIAIPSDAPREFNFISEKGAITVLSAILLSMASAFSMASLMMLVRAKDRHIWLWIIMTFGFAFLAFDELLQFHERAGRILDNYIGPGMFRTWDDVVVILYGVIALPIMVALLPNLIRFRMVIEIFAVSFLFYGIHTLIDSTQEPRTTMSVILEESAKLFSVEFLAIGAFVGYLGIVWNFAPSDGRSNDE